MSTGSMAIGVDVGGTKIAAGLVDAEGQVTRRMQRSTVGHDPAAVLETVTALVAELGAGIPDAEVGVGAAWCSIEALQRPNLAGLKKHACIASWQRTRTAPL
ncbi:ROK family protein [Paeniglutamicibacter antarcticus]|uniref:ROK family protein n=1 Tax=Paeniglutamicibacter antarcticus TaxID=494023 RepID=A0ABP9TKC7_9MICC